MQRRTEIKWTITARNQLAKLPKAARRGLLNKAKRLLEADDPRKAHKPLTGPLQGYYRITYSRYRAIYTVEEEEIASGDVYVRVRILFVAAGKRKERDRKDVYAIAERIVELGLANLGEDDDSTETGPTSEQ